MNLTIRLTDRPNLKRRFNKEAANRKLKVICYASKPSYYFDTFVRSCSIQELPPDILGWNKPFRGFGSRLKSYAKHIQTLNGFEWILHLDAYDSLLLESRQTILYKASCMEAPLIISAERNCFPNPERADEYPIAKSPYRFLCAGGWIGKREFLLDLFSDIRIHRIRNDCDDQALLTDIFISQRYPIRLDSQCSIFQNLFLAESDLVLKKQGIMNKITKTFPSVIHGNGKSRLEKYIAWSKLSN